MKYKKHWGLNRQGIIGKQDTPGNTERTNQQVKLKRTTKHGAEQEITLKSTQEHDTRPGNTGWDHNR